MRPRGRPVTTHCKEGHSLALHAYVASDGRRRCRLCRQRTWRQAKAQERARSRHLDVLELESTHD